MRRRSKISARDGAIDFVMDLCESDARSLLHAGQAITRAFADCRALVEPADSCKTGFVPRQIIHVDMDAFFAAVEQLDEPTLRGKPVLVGGDSPRGVVAAASYEARPFGVHSAMPMLEAKRRCPSAVVVRPRIGRYAEVSAAVFAVFHRYTPLVQGLSLDEAFLDVTESAALFGDGAAIARRVRDDIRQELRLTASAGVATSKFVAKVASDLDKPDGLVVVPVGQERSFLASLPIARMWGVGPKAEMRLGEIGFRTIGDLAASSPESLERLLGQWGRVVFQLARGEDDREVEVGVRPKSVGAEETFADDLVEVRDLERELLAQSRRVARRLLKSGLMGSVVTAKVKYRDHKVQTRQQKLTEPASDTDTIYRAARRLLRRFPELTRGVRLTGVAVSDLAPDGEQPLLFPDPDQEKRGRLERAVGFLEDRFGSRALTRAALLPPPDSSSSTSAVLALDAPRPEESVPTSGEPRARRRLPGLDC